MITNLMTIWLDGLNRILMMFFIGLRFNIIEPVQLIAVLKKEKTTMKNLMRKGMILSIGILIAGLICDASFSPPLLAGENVLTDYMRVKKGSLTVTSGEVGIDQGTTNLYTNPDMETGSTTGWSFDAKTNGTLDAYSTDKLSGSYCARIKNSTVDTIAFWENVSVTSGVTYTMSCYAKKIDCPTTPYFTSVGVAVTTLSGGGNFTGISTAGWTRYYWTFTANATGTLSAYIRTDANAAQGYFLLDDLQFEQKSAPTPFTKGTRADGDMFAGGKLTAGGMIESKSGGYKFPDGSIQASALVSGGWTKSGTSVYLTSTSDNVGIGTTTPGAYKLNVQGGDVNFTGNLLWSGGGSSNTNAHIQATSNVHGLTFTAEGSGGGLDADTLDTYDSSAIILGRSAVAGTNLDNVTTNGVYSVTETGHSEGMLVFNQGGSLGTFQLYAQYSGLLKWRNKTDNTTWQAWRTIWHDGSDGSGSGLDADTLDGHDTSYFQTALTYPVTGTGTANYHAKFTGTSAITDSLIFDNGTNVGIATATPGQKLDVGGSINITFGQKYKINNVNLAAADVGAEPILTKGNLTAGSAKVAIGGTGTGAVIGAGATVDVNEASLTLNNIGGTLGVSKGGTGATTFSDNYLLKGKTSSPIISSVIYDSGTNVGIGTTGTGYKLEIAGSIYALDGASLLRVSHASGATMTYSGLGLSIATANTNLTGPGGASIYLTGGNVGIGTTTPLYGLSVANTQALQTTVAKGYGSGILYDRKLLLDVTTSGDVEQSDTYARWVKLYYPGNYAGKNGGMFKIKIAYFPGHASGAVTFEYLAMQYIDGSGTNAYNDHNWGNFIVQQTGNTQAIYGYLDSTKLNYIINNIKFYNHRPTAGASGTNHGALIIKLPNSGTSRLIDIAIEVEALGKNTLESSISLTELGEGPSAQPAGCTELTVPKIWLASGSDVYRDTGNVGIGITSPSQKLQVAGIVESTTGGFKYPDGSIQTSALSSGGWTKAGSVVYVTTTTDNVGIGTTSSVNSLQIGSVGSSGYAGNQFAFGNGTQVSAFYLNTTAATWYTNTNFSLMPSGSGSTGNVGIGTTGPGVKLDVNGDMRTNANLYVSGLRFNANGSSYLRNYSGTNTEGGFQLYRNDGNLWGYFYADASGIGILNGAGSWAVIADGTINAANTSVSFHTGGTRRAFFDSNGLTFLQVNPYIYTGGSYVVIPSGASISGGTLYTANQIQARGGIGNDSAATLNIAGGTSGHTNFSAGNVGIGIATPTYRLQIGTTGSLADSIRIGSYAVTNNTRQYIGYARADTGLFESSGDGDTRDTVKAGVSGIRIVNSVGTVTPAAADNSVQLLTHIYNSGSRVALHANYDGNVGIGTQTPGQKLQVAGMIESTSGGFKYPDGSTQASANSAGGWTKSGANVYTSTTSDKVGIGETVPISGLDILTNTAMTGGWNRNLLLKSSYPVMVFHSTYATPASTFGGIGYDSSTKNLTFWSNASSVDVPATASSMVIQGSNVGIGTTSPGAYRLNVQGGPAYFTGAITSGSTITATQFNGSGAGLTSIPAGSLTPGNYSSVITSGTYNINITGSAGSVPWSGITSMPGYNAKTWAGNWGQHDNHGAYTDFSSVNQWGATFVQSNTNGPAWNGSSQNYQAYYSLGADYTTAQYGMQTTIPRSVANPYLSVRYKEASVWGAWYKISAGYADTATTLTGGGSVSATTGTFSSGVSVGQSTGTTLYSIRSGGGDDYLRLDGGNGYNNSAYIWLQTSVPTTYINYNQSNSRIYLRGGVSIGSGTDPGASDRLYVSGQSSLMGNVGIGRSDPQSQLHVHGSAPVGIMVTNASYPSTYRTVLGNWSGAQGILQFGNNGQNEIRFGATAAGGTGAIYTNNSAEWTAATNGNLALFLAANGNVGIGTSGPTQKLDVAGNVTAHVYYDRDNTGYWLDGSAANSIKLAGNIQGQGGAYITHTPWFNGGSAPVGYIKLITPIVDNESNMFVLRITGYHYGGTYGGSGNNQFTIHCSGYAYSGIPTGGGALISQGCYTEGTSMPVEIGVENRGGVNKVVVRMGTPSTSWYYNHFTVDYVGWQAKDPAGFQWVTGEATPAQTGNTNNVFVNNWGGTVNAVSGFYWNGQSLDARYLTAAGGTMTGGLNAPSIYSPIYYLSSLGDANHAIKKASDNFNGLTNGQQIRFWDYQNFYSPQSGLSVLHLQNNGLVGIGTTAPGSRLTMGTSFATTSGLTIDGGGTGDSQIAVRSAAGGTAFGILAHPANVYLSAGTYYDGSVWQIHSGNAYNQLLNMEPATGVNWYASGNGAASWNLASNVNLWNNYGYWKNLVQSTTAGVSYFTGGNVGIGVTSPSKKLVVGSNLHASNDGITLDGILDMAWGSGVGTPPGGIMRMWHDSATPSGGGLRIATSSNTSAFTLKTDGNVGIGTASPAAKLEIAGNIELGINNLIGWRYSAGDPGPYAYIQSDGAGSGLGYYAGSYTSGQSVQCHNFYTYTSGWQNRLMIRQDGNVGINTTSPIAKLHVNGRLSLAQGAYTGMLTFGSEESTWTTGISQYDSGWAELRMWTKSYGSIYFANSHDGLNVTSLPGDGMVLKYNKLGIGGWTAGEVPSEKLHVKGNILSTGLVNAGNYLQINSKYAIDGTDAWLRLNQQGSFSNGTYTPYGLRADGGLTAGGYGISGGEVRANFFRDGDSGYYVDPGDGLSAVFAGHIKQGQIVSPVATWASGGGTGAIIIKIPATTGMLQMEVNLYEYGGENATTYIIGGHNCCSRWYNYGCKKIGTSTKAVRLGHKDGQYCIVIGGVGTTWSYPSVALSKVVLSGVYGAMNMTGTYTITQDNTESYTWISEDLSNSVWGNADMVDGLHVNSTTTNNEANKIVRTEGNGYANFGWINTISGDSGVASRLTRIYSSNDAYLRYSTLADFKTHMGLSSKNVWNDRIDYTTDSNYWVGSMGKSGMGANEVFHGGSGFFDVWSGSNYPSGTSHIHGFNALHYTVNSLGSTGGNAYGIQVAGQYNQGGTLFTRGITSGSFSSWYKIWSEANDGSGSGLDSDYVDGLHASSFSRKDTWNQWIRPYYEYSNNYLTSEAPSTLRDQMGGGGLRVDFMHPNYTYNGGWGQVITWSGYQYYGMYQLSGYYGGATPGLAFRHEINAGTNTWSAWRTIIDSSNIGSQNVDTVDGMHANSNSEPTFGVLNFYGVGGNSGVGNRSYAIYQEGGAWSPPFPDLCIGYHTGIKLGAYYGYNGIRFYNNSDFATQTMSVNDGDNHVRVAYNLYVGGTLTVGGYIYKNGGGFQIDHPLDPANKVLIHSFVESPDMKNLYDGVVVLDANGESVIQLPDWFGALNKDFRYQLTPIGKPGMPYVKEEIKDNKFTIAGDPGMKVSWQVTGTRQDAYAEKHRIKVEEEKGTREGMPKKGEYLAEDCYK